jgi:type III pantothenate kinase
MNVAVDIGNTLLKCGIFLAPDKSEVNIVQIPPVGEKPDDFFVRCLLSWEPFFDVEGMLTADVYPKPLTWRIAPTGRWSWKEFKEAILPYRPKDRFKVITRKEIPLKINVDTPEKVGLDRLLAAFAAVEYYGDAPMLIVDAGSAITVDVVKNRTFCGGAILPGLAAQSETYSKISKKLPLVLVPFDMEKRVIVPPYPAKNTKEAIQSGYYWGTIGAIRQFYTMSFSHKERALLVLTGGDERYLFSGLSQVIPSRRIKRHDFLVLEGINQCYSE